jgi:SIT family siderophore-iron:H+ symporter-like MFS transporter
MVRADQTNSTLLNYSDQYTAGSFLPIAVSRAFGKHALQATINTITAVFQAMSQ